MARMVPIGIDLLASLKSPDLFDPAIIPESIIHTAPVRIYTSQLTARAMCNRNTVYHHSYKESQFTLKLIHSISIQRR